MYQYVKDRFSDAYILYKVESVRNKDLNLKELQQLLIINCIVVSLFSKTVRQEAREKGRKPFADLNLNPNN